jgi:hypothetical protein
VIGRCGCRLHIGCGKAQAAEQQFTIVSIANAPLFPVDRGTLATPNLDDGRRTELGQADNHLGQSRGYQSRCRCAEADQGQKAVVGRQCLRRGAEQAGENLALAVGGGFGPLRRLA